MALRGHHFSERCSACDEPAGGHCPRCGEIFCAEHQPPSDRRCDECEVVYAERFAALERVGLSWISPSLVVTTALSAGVTAAAGFAPVGLGILGFGALASLFIYFGERSDRRNPALRAASFEARALRRAFLAERTKLLGPGDFAER